jgi:hypothetical protein
MICLLRRHPAIPAMLVLLVGLGGCADTLVSKPPPMHYLIANGEEDVEDAYLSVVQVRIPGRGFCSGVVAGPHLVLTAAHCFCFPGTRALETRKVYSLAQQRKENEAGLECIQTTQISTAIHREESPSTLEFQGAVLVRPHEGYTFRTNELAEVIQSEADLAAVYLDAEFTGIKPDSRILDREVQPAEFIVAAGYGPTAPNEKSTGRHVGTSRVLDLDLRSGSDRVFAFGRRQVPLRHVYGLSGDSGGPCFREDSGRRRWIVGIMSHSIELKGEPITLFTSTFHHREWIQLQRELSDEFARNR